MPVEAVGEDEGAQAAAAERTRFVRADVAEGVVVAAEIEDADLPPIDGHDLAAAGRDLIGGCDYVRRHQSIP